jgi:hypothetical protein
MKTPGRDEAPLASGSPALMQATISYWRSAVNDASGTWNSPNPLGADGLTGLGEAAAAANVFYGIPDVLGGQCARYAGKRVTVVGSGHSAFNALLEFAELSGQEPGTEITWVVRRRQVASCLAASKATRCMDDSGVGRGSSAAWCVSNSWATSGCDAPLMGSSSLGTRAPNSDRWTRSCAQPADAETITLLANDIAPRA